MTEKVTTLAVFADLFDIPKVLIARRLSGPFEGHYTLIGGKNEGKTQIQTLREETWEESGVPLPLDKPINRLRNSINFSLGRHTFSMSLFYTWMGQGIADEYMFSLREPNKHTQWAFRPLSWIKEKSQEGFFPLPVYAGLVRATKKAGVPWIGDMTAAAFDYPHWGLHSVRSLRRKAGI